MEYIYDTILYEIKKTHETTLYSKIINDSL